jgi:hypothetical protein
MQTAHLIKRNLRSLLADICAPVAMCVTWTDLAVPGRFAPHAAGPTPADMQLSTGDCTTCYGTSAYLFQCVIRAYTSSSLC